MSELLYERSASTAEGVNWLKMLSTGGGVRLADGTIQPIAAHNEVVDPNSADHDFLGLRALESPHIAAKWVAERIAEAHNFYAPRMSMYSPFVAETVLARDYFAQIPDSFDPGSAIRRFISQVPNVSVAIVGDLKAALQRFFPLSSIDLGVHQDPELPHADLVLSVESGITDESEREALELAFFEWIVQRPLLHAALKRIIISVR